MTLTPIHAHGGRQTRQPVPGLAPELPSVSTEPGSRDSVLALGSDLALWVQRQHQSAEDSGGHVWTVIAGDADGNPLGLLATLDASTHPHGPDGATLALLADLARRGWPTHAELTWPEQQ